MLFRSLYFIAHNMATPKKSAGGKKRAAAKGSKGAKGSKLGLIFPVGRVGRLLRSGRYARRVAASGAVYMTSVLEYLTAELLDLTNKVITNSKKKSTRVTPRAITMAVRHDDDLGTLLKDVTFARGGVVPNVHASLQKKGKGAKKAAKATKKSSKKSSKSTPKA